MRWLFIVISSCRYQHLAFMLTHLPKILIVKGLHLFHQSLHIFTRDFLVKSSWSLWMLIVFIGVAYLMISSFLTHSIPRCLLEFSNQSYVVLVNHLIFHMRTHIMLISSGVTYVFLHPFKGGDPFPSIMLLKIEVLIYNHTTWHYKT